jgi:hypothetical protein
VCFANAPTVLHARWNRRDRLVAVSGYRDGLGLVGTARPVPQDAQGHERRRACVNGDGRVGHSDRPSRQTRSVELARFLSRQPSIPRCIALRKNVGHKSPPKDCPKRHKKACGRRRLAPAETKEKECAASSAVYSAEHHRNRQACRLMFSATTTPVTRCHAIPKGERVLLKAPSLCLTRPRQAGSRKPRRERT